MFAATNNLSEANLVTPYRLIGFAALSGVLIPIILKKIGVDPALGGGVILTTITDVIGFFSFLALGTIFLL